MVSSDVQYTVCARMAKMACVTASVDDSWSLRELCVQSKQWFTIGGDGGGCCAKRVALYLLSFPLSFSLRVRVFPTLFLSLFVCTCLFVFLSISLCPGLPLSVSVHLARLPLKLFGFSVYLSLFLCLSLSLFTSHVLLFSSFGLSVFLVAGVSLGLSW